MVAMAKKVIFFINVDWYFDLHWFDRAMYLKNSGYKVYVVTNFTNKKIKTKLIDRGFHVRQIDIDRKTINPLSLMKILFNFLLIVLSIRPDVIHNITVKPNLIGGLAARLCHVPVIFSITGLGTVFVSSKMRCRLSKLFVVFLFKRVAVGTTYRIIFENYYDQAVFKKLRIGDASCFHVIRGAGVDTELFAFSKTFPSERKILFAARMLWNKGLGDLIEASKILYSRGKKLNIEVAGIMDDQNIDAIGEEQILQWNRQGWINWLGQHDRMEELLRQVTMVILPSTYGEGVPRILIEAASAGRPLVTTDLPGCRDIVRHGYNGMLVPPSDPEKLADSIDEILEDGEKLARFGQRGRNMVEQCFSQKQVLSETFAIYNDPNFSNCRQSMVHGGHN